MTDQSITSETKPLWQGPHPYRGMTQTIVVVSYGVCKSTCFYMGGIAEHILEGGNKASNLEAGKNYWFVYHDILYTFCKQNWFFFVLYIFCIYFIYKLNTLTSKYTGEAEILINLLPTALDTFLATEIQKLIGAGHEDIDDPTPGCLDALLQFSEV